MWPWLLVLDELIWTEEKQSGCDETKPFFTACFCAWPSQVTEHIGHRLHSLQPCLEMGAGSGLSLCALAPGWDPAAALTFLTHCLPNQNHSLVAGIQFELSWPDFWGTWSSHNSCQSHGNSWPASWDPVCTAKDNIDGQPCCRCALPSAKHLNRKWPAKHKEKYFFWLHLLSASWHLLLLAVWCGMTCKYFRSYFLKYVRMHSSPAWYLQGNIFVFTGCRL